MRTGILLALTGVIAGAGGTAARAQQSDWARLLVDRIEAACNDRDTVAMAAVLAPEVTLHQPGQAERRETRAVYARDLRAMLLRQTGTRVWTMEELLSPELIIRRELVTGAPGRRSAQEVRIYRVTPAGIEEVWAIPIDDPVPTGNGAWISTSL
jgi:hypothetical protein